MSNMRNHPVSVSEPSPTLSGWRLGLAAGALANPVAQYRRSTLLLDHFPVGFTAYARNMD